MGQQASREEKVKGIKAAVEEREGVVRNRFRGDGLNDRSIIYVSYAI